MNALPQSDPASPPTCRLQRMEGAVKSKQVRTGACDVGLLPPKDRARRLVGSRPRGRISAWAQGSEVPDPSAHSLMGERHFALFNCSDGVPTPLIEGPVFLHPQIGTCADHGVSSHAAQAKSFNDLAPDAQIRSRADLAAIHLCGGLARKLEPCAIVSMLRWHLHCPRMGCAMGTMPWSWGLDPGTRMMMARSTPSDWVADLAPA